LVIPEDKDESLISRKINFADKSIANTSLSRVEESQTDLGDDFIMEPMKMTEALFKTWVKDYLEKKIEKRVADSFYDCDQLLAKQANGYERHYIKLMLAGSKEPQGLAVFNVDHTTQGEFRGYIRHLSTVDVTKLQKAAELVINFIWKTVYCQHIRLELFHKQDSAGKFQADPDVKNAFSKLGFKWKTLSNDPHTGKRAQIMQLSRPITAPGFDKKYRKMEPGVEPLTIKAAFIIGLHSGPVVTPDT
jgi:hypothetical protein